MAQRRGKDKSRGSFGGLVEFVQTINDTFEALTGKTVPAWFEEFRQRPRELSPGEEGPSLELVMPLADAYAVMGLPQTASKDQVKERYRALSRLFHPDSLEGSQEAMILLNNANDRINSEKEGG